MDDLTNEKFLILEMYFLIILPNALEISNKIYN